MVTDQNVNGSSNYLNVEPEHITKCVDFNSFELLIRHEPDALDLILKGHHAVETFLNGSLIESLYESDALELSRIAFLLKTDLLIALGFIPKTRRPLFNRLNSYRNKFAHDPHYKIEKEYSDETSRLLQSLEPDIFELMFELEISEEKDFISERRLVFICWATCIHCLCAACKSNIACSVSGRAIEKMQRGVKVFSNGNSIGNHWKECEAELLKERYPTFFSKWPTHYEKKSDSNL